MTIDCTQSEWKSYLRSRYGPIEARTYGVNVITVLYYATCERNIFDLPVHVGSWEEGIGWDFSDVGF